MGDIWPYGPPAHVTWMQAFTAMNSLGRSQNDCAIFAAIAQAESGLDYRVINDTPATGDYSVGLWQINYFGSLYGPRAAAYGTPAQLVAGGLTRQAIAANAIGATSFTAWSTFNSGAYLPYLNGGSPPGPGGSGSAPPTVQEGSTGAFVQQLQRDLDQLGWTLAVDGDFGPLTHAAVVSFQGQQGIAQDGIVGPVTWQHLADAIATAQGGGSPGPASIPPPPSQPPGNIDADTVNAWSSLATSVPAAISTMLASATSAANTLNGV